MGENGPSGESRVHVNVRVRKHTLGREKRNLLMVWLSVIMASAICAEAILALSGILAFNIVEVLADALLAIYAYAFLYRHYSGYRPSRSALVNRRKSWMILFTILFVPAYASTYIVYSLGFTAIYDPAGFAVFYLAFQTVFFFIVSSWFWNRRFINLSMPAPIRLLIDNGTVGDIQRDETIPKDAERIIRKYIAGRIDSIDFIEMLGDSPLTPQLLKMAETLKTELRKKYRW